MRLKLCAVAPLLWLTTAVSHAESTSTEETQPPDARAQELFDEGRGLMEQSRFVEACRKLQASYRIDPATGTLLNLAVCLEQVGKRASAYRAYQDAIERSAREGNLERQRLAESRVIALEPMLARIVLAFEQREVGFWLTIDGEPVNVTVARSVPVDVGEHIVTYGAPNRAVVSVTVNAPRPAENVEVRIHFERAPAPKPSPHVAPPARTATAASEPSRWVVAGLGFSVAASGAIATTYFGIRARNEWDERNRLCSPSCTSEAQQAGERAQGFAWLADASAGVALLSAGFASYWLLSTHSQPSRARPVTLGSNLSKQGVGVSAAIAF